MRWKLMVLCTSLLAACWIAPAAADIVVTVDPAYKLAGPGSFFDLELRADTPGLVNDYVLGWGLDVWFDETVIDLQSVTGGPDWTLAAAPTPDPDDPTVDLNLLAVSFPPGAGIEMDDNLLATLHFQAVGDVGDLTFVILGDHRDLGDPNEGFLLDPSCEWALVSYSPGIVEIPEPATVLLLGLGVLGLIRRR